MNETLAKIRKQRTKWIAAINAGSASHFVDVLTDDVVWLPARHDAIPGKEQIQAWLEKPFADFNYDYSVSQIRLRLAGNWAIEQARFTTRARTSSGQPLPLHTGDYTLLWRKTPAGEWLIERYIDHSADFVREG
jgi:uncharacterized protein (TIGR02246 family)